MMKISNIWNLNWLATIALNYKAGGLRQVFRMPIKVYGKLKWHVNGQILLPSNAIRNTLIIGSVHEDYTASSGRAELNINGTLDIGGIVRVGPECFIGVGQDGILHIGNGTMIARDSQIHCAKEIVIGDDVFAGEMYITDSAIHQIVDNGKQKELNSTVQIGDGTYLGFRCVLLKGCIIPPRSVVASGAVCTKDYSKAGHENLFITGVPAEVKSHGVYAIK